MDHFKKLKDSKHGNQHLQFAWNKYGESKFVVTVLKTCKAEDCVKNEQRFIDKYQSADRKFGYNKSLTAGSTLGVRLSAITCLRISESKKGVYVGRKMSDEQRKLMSNALQGNTNGTGNKGRKMPEAERKGHIVEMTGKRFERLTVIRFYDLKPHARWLCKCDCGKDVIVYGNSLRKGKSRSCGCLLTDILIRRNKSGKLRKGCQ